MRTITMITLLTLSACAAKTAPTAIATPDPGVEPAPVVETAAPDAVEPAEVEQTSPAKPEGASPMGSLFGERDVRPDGSDSEPEPGFELKPAADGDWLVGKWSLDFDCSIAESAKGSSQTIPSPPEGTFVHMTLQQSGEASLHISRGGQEMKDDAGWRRVDEKLQIVKPAAGGGYRSSSKAAEVKKKEDGGMLLIDGARVICWAPVK